MSDCGEQGRTMPTGPIEDNFVSVVKACGACGYSQHFPAESAWRPIDCPRCCARMEERG